MTDQEIYVLLQYLKRNHYAIYRSAMIHVQNFTRFIDDETSRWLELQKLNESLEGVVPPTLSRLTMNDVKEENLFDDDESETKFRVVEHWKTSPSPMKADDELLDRLVKQGLLE